MRNISFRMFLIPLFILLLIAPSCVVQQSPVSGNRRAYGYSWEQEIQIGREADREIQQQYGVYSDEMVSDYVDEVGREVLSVSHMRREGTDERYRNTEFYFRVLNSPVVNAFALPGGYIYVTRGLLTHLNNEAQLAVVLGHEIGHVAARHASQRAFEQQVGQIALIGGAVAGQELLGLPGQSLLGLGSTAAQLMFLQYGRDDERESDALGVEYAAMREYEAAEGADFFTTLRRISENTGKSIPSFLSTHPDPGERENTIPQLAGEWEERGYDQHLINKDRFMDAIDNMIYGNNPREGFTRNQFFYHPDLEFQFPYPVDWQVINESNRVIIVNEEGDAVILMQIDAESPDAQASVRSFLTREGVVTLSRSPMENNGLQAYQAVAAAETEEGAELRIFVYGVEFDGNVYRFISYTTADLFSEHRPRFEDTAHGFSRLHDTEILEIDPARLRVTRTGRAGSFSSFLPDDLPMDVTAEELAILNQVELDDRIEAGSYLKLVE